MDDSAWWDTLVPLPGEEDLRPWFREALGMKDDDLAASEELASA